LGQSANAVGGQLSYFDDKEQTAFDTLLEANQGGKSDTFTFANLERTYQEAGMEVPDFIRNMFES